jgi:hypothetical protein
VRNSPGSRDLTRALREFTSFLARAYELKSIAEYGVDPEIVISADDAKAALDIATRFVANVAAKLSQTPGKSA